VLGVLGSAESPQGLPQILEKAGRQLAKGAGLSRLSSFQEGLDAAMKAANALGADTEAEFQADQVIVRNYSCPLGGAVRGQLCVCTALAAFFSEATGQPAVEQCLRDERLICQYVINRP
jgi:predicted ArsR family transcriptional regulator